VNLNIYSGTDMAVHASSVAEIAAMAVRFYLYLNINIGTFTDGLSYKGDTSTHAEGTDPGGASRASKDQKALWPPYAQSSSPP